MVQSTATQPKPKAIPVERTSTSRATLGFLDDETTDHLPVFAVEVQSPDWQPAVVIQDILTVTMRPLAHLGDLDLVIVDRDGVLFATHLLDVEPGDEVLGEVEGLWRLVGPTEVRAAFVNTAAAVPVEAVR